MKKILILAGGTATAWHLCNVLKNNFANDFILCIGDINPQNLIPSSILCDEYYQLPLISSDTYYLYMLNLLKINNIDIVVPLIDFDLTLFANDNEDLLDMGIISTAPSSKVMNICKSKTQISKLLNENFIKVPEYYTQKNILSNHNYFVKPNEGFGSKNAKVMAGKDIIFSDKIIVQEILSFPEITVEIFKKGNDLFYVCRERIETKAGVCTKARFFNSREIEEIIKKITAIIELPLVSCIQFMKSSDGEWSLTDLNLRLGAGTALSSAVGFCISAAFLSVLAGKNNYKSYLKNVQDGLQVVRVYSEIVMP